MRSNYTPIKQLFNLFLHNPEADMPLFWLFFFPGNEKQEKSRTPAHAKAEPSISDLAQRTRFFRTKINRQCKPAIV